MTAKPREKLHLIHLRCMHCNCYHNNTHNLGTVAVISTLYQNNPLGNGAVQHLSQGGMAFDCLRQLNTPFYSEYYTHFAEAQNARVNMMETLELDMPSDTVSIPESMPPLENLSLDSLYWE